MPSHIYFMVSQPHTSNKDRTTSWRALGNAVFFNVSWGVGSWTYAVEIFPLALRAKGNALSTMSLWTACYIVAQVSPPIAEAIGWGLYIIYAGICVVAFAFVRYAMVETRGRSLEEMSRIFGIEESLARKSGVEVDDVEVLKGGVRVARYEEGAR